MEPFQIVHRFRTLANRGYISPLTCECGGQLTIRLSPDDLDEPWAKCYTCGTSANVSMATLLLMESVIHDYEVNRK